MGEALHALGVPTTRMLAAVATGVPVYREEVLPGAIVTRVAQSHLRVGTFQYFAARGEKAQLKQLITYALHRHFPEEAHSANPGMALVRAVSRAQGILIAKWMSIGFIHGVMNTDNMAISGETIDFGPCAMMDRYHPKTVFSSIDRMGRYAFGNQPSIGQWNLARFAEAILHALDNPSEKEIEEAHEALTAFSDTYQKVWTGEMMEKLGLLEPKEGDASILTGFQDLLLETRSDYTSTFRTLAQHARDPLSTSWPEEWKSWLGIWENRILLQEGAREELPSEWIVKTRLWFHAIIWWRKHSKPHWKGISGPSIPCSNGCVRLLSSPKKTIVLRNLPPTSLRPPTRPLRYVSSDSTSGKIHFQAQKTRRRRGASGLNCRFD